MFYFFNFIDYRARSRELERKWTDAAVVCRLRDERGKTREENKTKLQT